MRSSASDHLTLKGLFYRVSCWQLYLSVSSRLQRKTHPERPKGDTTKKESLRPCVLSCLFPKAECFGPQVPRLLSVYPPLLMSTGPPGWTECSA